MKILLVNPPNLEEDQLDAQTIPLGLLYIKEFTKSNGYDVDTLNLYFEENWEDVKTKLKKINYDIVGIPCYTRQRFSVFKLAKVCREINENSKIVLGGPHATYLDNLILEKFRFIDYIIRGEGEYTFLELMSNLEKSKCNGLYGVNGLTLRNNDGTIIKNMDRKPIGNLDVLPPPTYSDDDLSWFPKCESLKFHFLKIADDRNECIAPALSSRGCNYNCIFCCNGAYWGRQRYHTPTYVFEEIKKLYDKFEIKFFDFYDDNFTTYKNHVTELCNLLIKNNIDIHWWCSSRAEGIDRSILARMKGAGCFMISYGLESGSQEILNNIRKAIKIEDMIRTCHLTKKEGIFLRCTISIGNPGENDETIKKTINLIRKLKPDQLGIFLVKMYPGTPLYQRGIKEGIIDDDYWFDKKKPSVPFYTSENSFNKLLDYRNIIAKSVERYVTSVYENKTYNLELDLEW